MHTATETLESPKATAVKFFTPARIASIDILRALTMVLMIFVNDLWSLKGIPVWLEHVPSGVDGIGLADIVFPAFLFIVGLSLPFAVENRRKKGDTQWQLIQHVLVRTIALLVMGVFLVNGETINAAATGMPRYAWYSISCFCFILIWNLYSRQANRDVVYAAKAIGIVTLIFLAFIYSGGEDGEIIRFAPHWWGILGLIGWAYLASGLVMVFSKNNFWVILAAWAFFCVLSMASKAGYVPSFLSFIPSAILGGTLTGLTMSGVLTAMIFRFFRKRNQNVKMTVVFVVFAMLLFLLAFITRPYWKLAKLGATPAWLFLCSGITLLAFTAIYWIADMNKKANWFKVIKPAGTDTLLCYLIPYFLYALFTVVHLQWPDVMITGGIGLFKSFLFALLCVFITGLLNKAGVRLKL